MCIFQDGIPHIVQATIDPSLQQKRRQIHLRAITDTTRSIMSMRIQWIYSKARNTSCHGNYSMALQEPIIDGLNA